VIELEKVILQVSIYVFFGHCQSVEKIFGQRWLSPLEKIALFTYDLHVVLFTEMALTDKDVRCF